MSVDCVVIDGGARYGLHPSWAELRGLVDFHLFEMDEHECRRLSQKYRDDPRIRIYPLALYKEDTALRYTVTQHRALNSVFDSNSDLLRRNDYMLRDFSPCEERAVEARSIDSLFVGRDVHFLKLDTEGAELDILRGATGALDATILGVRSEVLFAPVYKEAPLFGDIHRFMLDHGFELLNLDYHGAGNKAGRFTMPNRYGKLLSSDAVWVVGNDRLFAATGERLLHDIIRLALFLMLNGATDLAVDTLLRANRAGLSFISVVEDSLFRALHRKILLLFKDLLSMPMLEKDDITTTYRTIFGLDFPLMNRFYESDLFL
jgi:FkbM family methyltransferase